jgi:hypothetical protein
MTATVFLILLVCLLTMRFFFTCMIALLIGIFILADTPPVHADPYGEIDHKQDANWRGTVDRVTRLSAKQNHGHPDLTHSCYAEDKKAFCATVVAYVETNGNLAFIRIIRNGEDNSLFARDVCVFNKQKTLRTCVNFDNGYKSKWVENKDGEWVQIDREKADDEAASGGL